MNSNRRVMSLATSFAPWLFRRRLDAAVPGAAVATGIGPDLSSDLPGLACESAADRQLDRTAPKHFVGTRARVPVVPVVSVVPVVPVVPETGSCTRAGWPGHDALADG